MSPPRPLVAIGGGPIRGGPIEGGAIKGGVVLSRSVAHAPLWLAATPLPASPLGGRWLTHRFRHRGGRIDLPSLLRNASFFVFLVWGPGLASGQASPPPGVVVSRGPAELVTYRWDFSRGTDRNFDGWPDDWTRRSGPRHPNYVDIRIQPLAPGWSTIADRIDTWLLLNWPTLRQWMPPLPPAAPSVADQTVTRGLEVTLDGGLASITSPAVECQTAYQYRLTTRVETIGAAARPPHGLN